MPPIAAIDIGSNSALLLIAENVSGGDWRVLLDCRRTVRLTKSPQAPGVIPEDTIEALESALSEYSRLVDSHKATGRVVVGATQALRAAVNGQLIADRLQLQFGWQVRILSAEAEARLSYLAAATGIDSVTSNRSVIDVGGGSTEIIRGEAENIRASTSIPIGAVSLTERLRLPDTIPPQELEQAGALVAAELASAAADFLPPAPTTIIVGGTASTLAAIYLGLKDFDPQAVHGVQLKTDWIEGQLLQLAGMSLTRRQELISFDPDRAEIIVGGVLILARLLRLMKLESVIVSNRGLRWGLLVEAAVTIEAD